MPAASSSLSVGSSAATTTSASDSGTSKKEPSSQPTEAPPALDLDDSVFLIDPTVGILQGVITNIGHDDNVCVQLTGPSLGKGGINSRKRDRPPGWSGQIANPNYVARPIDYVYRRHTITPDVATLPSADELFNTIVEKRQSTVQAGGTLEFANPKTLKQSRPWNLFQKRQPILRSKDLDYLESVLSADQPLAFCLWDALESTVALTNPAFLQLTGQTLRKTLGSNLDFLTGPQTNVTHIEAWRKAFQQTGNCHLVILHYRSAATDDSFFFHRMFLTPLCMENNQIRYYLSLHGQVSATEAARLNHKEGWPMPAIFNLKGSIHHSTRAVLNEAPTENGSAEVKEPANNPSNPAENTEAETAVDATATKDATSQAENTGKESDNPHIEISKEDENFDVSPWLPDFSIHATKPKTPKKHKKHSKKKKTTDSLTETADPIAENPSGETETPPSETLTSTDSSTELSTERATQIETNALASEKATGSPKGTTKKKKKRSSASAKRRASASHEHASTPRRERLSASPSPRRERPGAPASPRQERVGVSDSGRKSPHRSSTPRREILGSRQPSPGRSSTPMRRNTSPRRRSAQNKDRLVLSPTSQSRSQSDPSVSSSGTEKNQTIDLACDNPIANLGNLLSSQGQPASLTATHHTQTSCSTELFMIADNSSLDYEPVTVAPKAPVSVSSFNLQQGDLGNGDSAKPATSGRNQEASTVGDSENGSPRRSSAPQPDGVSVAESEKSTGRIIKPGESRRPSQRRRRKSAEPTIVSPRKTSSRESSPRRTRSAEPRRPSPPRCPTQSGRLSPQKRRSSADSPRRRRSGESTRRRKSGESSRRASGGSGRNPSRRRSSKTQEEDLGKDRSGRMSPRRMSKSSQQEKGIELGTSRRKKSNQQGEDSLSANDAARGTLQKSRTPCPDTQKSLPSQAPTEDSSSSSDDDAPVGQMGLFRGNSIGDLHDVLFSQQASLSETHHTMSSYTEEQSLPLEEAAVMSPKPPSPSPRSLLDTTHTINSISEVHDLLYSQRNMSTHTVTTLSEADPTVVNEKRPPGVPLSPGRKVPFSPGRKISLSPGQTVPLSPGQTVPLSPGQTQHSATSISEVHSILYNSHSGGLDAATEHSIPASTMSNE